MLSLLMAAVFMVQGASSTSAAPVAIPLPEIREHLLGEWPQIRVQPAPNLSPEQKSLLAFGSVTFKVIVDANGNVVSTQYNPEIIAVPPDVVLQAEAEMRAAHFKPFERDGHRITAEFLFGVGLLPPELKTTGHVPFPKVKNWKNVKITLKSPKCYWDNCAF